MGKAVKQDIEDRLRLLENEADARRARISGDIDELSWRMKPGNLVVEAKDAVLREVDRATDAFLALSADLAEDIGGWARGNAKWLGGGAVAAGVVGVGIWLATRRETVPIYEAYDQEDFDMTDTEATLGGRANATWDKVKDEAREAGHKAGEAYYAARSKAAELSLEARERASHAADVARERAAEAAEAARDAADRAREAAGEAGRWAKRQPQDHPVTTIVGAVAAGVLLGLLIPSNRD